MQTFLPYSDFRETAECLDYRRLGKQRVEAKQILIALGVTVGDHKGKISSRWRSHPAVNMWRGFEAALCVYAVDMCDEWASRGYRDSLKFQFVNAYMNLRDLTGELIKYPSWLGEEDFHSSHRSNLLRKDPEWYGQFGWSEPATMEYVWPTTGNATLV